MALTEAWWACSALSIATSVPSMFRMQTLEQVGGDEPNLFAALAKRRQRQGVAGEASQQILAERAALDELLEVSVCRRDDANVDAQGLRRADRYDLALLQDA